MRKKKSKDTIKYNCFAYKKSLDNSEKIGECIALDEFYCKYGNCSFYKTEQRDVASKSAH